MPGKSLREDQYLGACPNSRRIHRIRAEMRGELLVEPGKPCPRPGNIASRHGGKCGVEFGGHTETGNNVAKLNDRAADRECRHQLRPLQRLSLVRQCWSRPYIRPSQSSDVRGRDH